MNSLIDDRISAALRARAGQVSDSDLSPAVVPVGRHAPVDRSRWAVPLLAATAAGVVAVATVATVRASQSSGPAPAAPITSPTLNTPAPTSGSNSQPLPTHSARPSPSGSRPSQSMSAPSSPQSGSQPVPSASGSAGSAGSAGSVGSPSGKPPAPAFVLGYQPLWPFGSYQAAEQWRTHGSGSQPWHLDAGQTALSFTRSYLGFTELTTVTGQRTDAQGAHVGVGYRDPNGQLRTSATLHLVRYGDAADSPWEVVGSDDTTLSLEQPAYGSTVTSPMTIGGHITGVDENIVVSVLHSTSSGTDRATLARVPAGGNNSLWTTGAVSFAQHGVLTIVASTGGHLQQVERFAIQGVHT